MALSVPNVLLGPISLGTFCFLGRNTGLQRTPFDKTPVSDQEDVNGEKLTVKKWWIFGADFFTFCCRFFTVYADFSRFVRDINGEKRIILIDDLFHG